MELEVKKEIVVCNERGDWWRYKSDRYGYNNPDEVWDEKFIDLAFVGDSFTHGSCINGEKIYVELLRDNYAKTLNLASLRYWPTYISRCF